MMQVYGDMRLMERRQAKRVLLDVVLYEINDQKQLRAVPLKGAELA